MFVLVATAEEVEGPGWVRFSHEAGDSTSLSELESTLDELQEDGLFRVDFLGRKIGIRGCRLLGRMMDRLTHLRLGNAELDETCAGLLARALEDNNSLVQLHLHRNEVQDDGACELASALETNQHLQELDLTCNQIGPEGGKALMLALHSNFTLRQVKLGRNELGRRLGGGGGGRVGFEDALQANSTLQVLDLSCNHAGFELCQDLAAGLQANTSLCKLSLFGNEQLGGGRDCIDLLCAALEVNCTLQELDLGGITLSAESVEAIAHGIIRKSCVRVLGLRQTGLGPNNVAVLAKALLTTTGEEEEEEERKCKLTRLDLAQNELGEDGVLAVLHAMMMQEGLEMVNLDWNDADVEALLLSSAAFKEAGLAARVTFSLWTALAPSSSASASTPPPWGNFQDDDLV